MYLLMLELILINSILFYFNSLLSILLLLNSINLFLLKMLSIYLFYFILGFLLFMSVLLNNLLLNDLRLLALLLFLSVYTHMCHLILCLLTSIYLIFYLCLLAWNTTNRNLMFIFLLLHLYFYLNIKYWGLEGGLVFMSFKLIIFYI